VGPRTGLDDVEKRKFLPLPGLELGRLGRPARSQSLYRLRYPGSRYRWEDNIKMDINEIALEVVDRVRLIRIGDQWCPLVNSEPWGPEMAVRFLTLVSLDFEVLTVFVSKK
jgi:hypothetical protein